MCYNKAQPGKCTQFNSTLLEHEGELPSFLTPLPTAWTPTDFCASVWATGLDGVRGIVKAANGDILAVDSALNRIIALWDDNKDGVRRTSGDCVGFRYKSRNCDIQ